MKAAILLFVGLCITSILFSQTPPKRSYETVRDSLLKKHKKQTPIVFSVPLDMAVLNLFFYKKGKKWHGIMFKDASLVNPESQFVHVIRMRTFDADTIGPKLMALGVDKLKQYNLDELSKYYNQKMKALKNPNVEYDLPYCSDGGSKTILFKGQSYTYSDCFYTNSVLQTLPEIKRFYEVTNYLQVKISPRVEIIKR